MHFAGNPQQPAEIWQLRWDTCSKHATRAIDLRGGKYCRRRHLPRARIARRDTAAIRVEYAIIAKVANISCT